MKIVFSHILIVDAWTDQATAAVSLAGISAAWKKTHNSEKKTSFFILGKYTE